MQSRYQKLLIVPAVLGLGLCCLGVLQLATAQPPGPGEKEGSALAEERSVDGVIEKLLRNDHDDVDGMALSDDVEVHFPPHVGRTVESKLKVGDRVQARGRDHTRPRGEKVFEALQITSGETVIRVDPPRPQRDRRQPPRGPGDDRGPGEGRGPGADHGPGRDGQHPEAGPDDGPRREPPHEEILRELREIRKLIEAQSRDR